MTSGIGCTSTALDYFTPRLVHNELLTWNRVTERTSQPIADATTITFDINGSPDYIDPNGCNVVLSLKVVQANGNEMPTSGTVPNVALSDNVMASLFKSVTLYMNTERITESNVYQVYENYFTTRYGLSKNAMQTHVKHLMGLTTELAGKSDTFTNAATGWYERKGWIAGSKVVKFVAPIPCDFFKSCAQYIPPGQTIRVEFKLNDSDFVLTGEGNCKYKLINIELDMLHIEVAPSKTMAIYQQQKLGPIQLHFSNIQVQSHTIPAKAPIANLRGLFRDKNPSQIFMLLVETDRINGLMGKDPYKFEHANVAKVVLRRNGLAVGNVEHLTDFEGGDAKVLYDRVIEAFQVGYNGTDNNLSYAQFLNGSTMWAWTLAPDNDAKSEVSMAKIKGDFDVDIEVKQGKANTNPNLTALFLAKFGATVYIDERNQTIVA
jgi:hypothetical protein